MTNTVDTIAANKAIIWPLTDAELAVWAHTKYATQARTYLLHGNVDYARIAAKIARKWYAILAEAKLENAKRN